MTASDAPNKAGPREWVGLAVLALPTFLVSIDLFSLLLALPHLSTDLGASSIQQLWIMDMYGFMLAGFLVTMGTLGDRIGRRRLLLIGAAAFGVASLLTAYSQSPGMLIASRALLGISGATLTPSTLALITNMFRDDKERASAIGMWSGTFVLGAIVGPVIGGVLLEHFWWGSVFLLAVPVMVLLLIIGPLVLPEYRAPGSGRLDPASVVLSLATMLPIVYGIKQLARDGGKPLAIVAILIGVMAGYLFGRRQRRLSDPLLDLRLFANRSFSTALGSQLSYSFMGGGFMLMSMLYFQVVDGMSTLRASVAMVPGMAAAVLGFMVLPVLARKVRPAFVISGGVAGVAAVMLVFTRVGPTHGAPTLIIGFAILSFCGSALVALGTNLVVSSAPMEKAGSAGSMAQMSNEFGSTLGIAILGSIGTAVYRHDIALPNGVTGSAAASAHDSVNGAAVAAGGLPDQVGSALLTSAHAAFANELNVVAGIGAVLLAGVAILIAALLRHVPPIGQGQQGPAPAADEAAAETADASANGSANGSGATAGKGEAAVPSEEATN